MADAERLAALARVRYRTAELAIEHDDWTIDFCIDVAIIEELVINGPDPLSPREPEEVQD